MSYHDFYSARLLSSALERASSVHGVTPEFLSGIPAGPKRKYIDDITILVIDLED